MANLFTSDTHFGHANIITYCSRPFSSVEEMNEKMIEMWNAKVRPEDTVYHLGDFAMGKKENVYIRRRLNGKIVLIKGNHDRSTDLLLSAGFDEVHKNLLVHLEGCTLYMAHIPAHLPDPTHRTYPPALVPPLPNHFDYFLCGHVHEQWKRVDNTINVGVDVSNYVPLTFDELLSRE